MFLHWKRAQPLFLRNGTAAIMMHKALYGTAAKRRYRRKSRQVFGAMGSSQFRRGVGRVLWAARSNGSRKARARFGWTRLSCRSFTANAVRLQLHALAYNLGNFLRTLATPEPIKNWSLTSLKQKLIKIGAKVVSHGRYVAFQMAEVAIPRHLFADILRLIAELRSPPAPPQTPGGNEFISICDAFHESPPKRCVLMTENWHPSACCYREGQPDPETNVQAAAGSQLHFRLVKVCPCVRVSNAIRPLSGECRIWRVSTGRSASMAQGHRFKSEWPSEALSDARRPDSGRVGRYQKVRGRLECDALDMQARSARRWSLAWLASSPSRQRKPMSSTSASAHPPARQRTHLHLRIGQSSATGNAASDPGFDLITSLTFNPPAGGGRE